MRTLRATIEYDGTLFAGFQVQRGLRTVQGELEGAIGRITGVPTTVVGAGRTDAGVHATGQVVSFRTESALPAARLQAAINATVGEDLVAHALVDAPEGFHARFSARWRAYVYTIWNAPERPAIGRQYVYHWRKALDVGAMDDAGRALVGRHDFASFAGSTRGEDRAAGTTRCIHLLRCERTGERVTCTVVADAFLPHMVRNLIGTLLLVGRGELDAAVVATILAARDRRCAGRTIPARGLCLIRVGYADYIDGDASPSGTPASGRPKGERNG